MNDLLKKAIKNIAYIAYLDGFKDAVSRLDFEEGDARKARLLQMAEISAEEYSNAVIGEINGG